MMKLYDFDELELLTDQRAIDGFVTEALETKDLEFIARALTIAEHAQAKLQHTESKPLSALQLVSTLFAQGYQILPPNTV